MENHLNTFRVHRVIAVIYLLIVMLCLGAAAIGAFFSNPGSRSGREMLLVGGVMAAVFLVPCLIHWAVARAARERKEWARIVSLVIGCIMLIGFPIGTAVGILLLYFSRWNLAQISQVASAPVTENNYG